MRAKKMSYVGLEIPRKPRPQKKWATNTAASLNVERRKRVKDFRLIGLNGNAFVLLGVFRKLARRDPDWTQEQIDKVTAEAKSDDYDHLLQTLMKYEDYK